MNAIDNPQLFSVVNEAEEAAQKAAEIAAAVAAVTPASPIVQGAAAVETISNLISEVTDGAPPVPQSPAEVQS